jgi:hypothetical protein
MNAHKVFDVEHLDFTESATANLGGKLFGTKSRSLGHGDAHDHWGTGNGVVTTLVPTLVISAGTSNPIPPISYALPLSTPYPVDATQLQLNHVIPPVDFPDFDGSSPKLWIRNCENYFELYAVPDFHKIRIASMHFVSNAAFWVQSLDYSIK